MNTTNRTELITQLVAAQIGSGAYFPLDKHRLVENAEDILITISNRYQEDEVKEGFEYFTLGALGEVKEIVEWYVKNERHDLAIQVLQLYHLETIADYVKDIAKDGIHTFEQQYKDN